MCRTIALIFTIGIACVTAHALPFVKKKSTKNKRMKKILLITGYSLLLFPVLFARQVTDMAGRTVTIPDNISRVVPYDNKTNVLLYPIAKEKMIVKARAKVSPDLKYITKDFLRLKEIDTRNAEEVLRINPDLIIVGAFVDNKNGLNSYIEFSEKINIPLIIVDLELTRLDKTYAFLGELFDCNEKAAEYVIYIQSVYTDIKNLGDKKTEGKAYLANETNGLRTAPYGSRHAQIFDIMNIENVAHTKLNTDGFGIVSMEQVLIWNPGYIFCLGKGENGPYRTILKSALWRNINAVQNHKVYIIPSEPYPWFDMPPSINRLAGLIWFFNIFYDQPPEVTKNKVEEFYRLFYNYSLNDEEYEKLFKWQ